jgi:Holliday junction resolvase RusA-like endonuclease
MYFLILEVNPEPWAIGDVGIHRKGGKIGAHVGQNVQLHAYQEAVREAVREEAQFQLQGRVSDFPLSNEIRLEFFLWRQQADYETTSGRRARKHRVDATNMQKGLEDALQGILYENDTQVVDVHTVIMEQGFDVRPLIVVGIEETSEDDDRQLLSLPDDIRFEVLNLLAGNEDLFQNQLGSDL